MAWHVSKEDAMALQWNVDARGAAVKEPLEKEQVQNCGGAPVLS